VLNGYPLNGAALNGVAAQPSGSATLAAVLALVTLVAAPAPVLAPISSAPLAPPTAAPPPPPVPLAQYVALAEAFPAAHRPLVSAAVIPQPLAILGSTVFIDLADPLVVVAPPITSAVLFPRPATVLPQVVGAGLFSLGGPASLFVPLVLTPARVAASFTVPAHVQHQTRKVGVASRSMAAPGSTTARSGNNSSSGTDPQ